MVAACVASIGLTSPQCLLYGEDNAANASKHKPSPAS